MADEFKGLFWRLREFLVFENKHSGGVISEAAGECRIELDAFIAAVPDLEVAKMNIVRPAFSEDHAEWVLWCGQEITANRAFKAIELLHAAVTERKDDENDK
jgi:CYTH domain-containing protein